MAAKCETFFAVFCLIAVVAVRSHDENLFCANPIVEKDNIADIKFIHEHYQQGWNVQFGNTAFRQRISQLLHGSSSLNEDIDYSKMCLRVKFDFVDESIFFGSFSGFSHLSVRWNCTDSNNTYDCNFYSNRNEYKDQGKVYLVYFDGNEKHNTAGLAFCFDDGVVGWFAASLTKALSERESQTLLNRFGSIGFNPDRRVPLRSNTDTCL